MSEPGLLLPPERILPVQLATVYFFHQNENQAMIQSAWVLRKQREYIAAVGSPWGAGFTVSSHPGM
jgi:hypothetical protein